MYDAPQKRIRTLPDVRFILSRKLGDRLPHEDCSLCHRPSFARRCVRGLSAASLTLGRWCASWRTRAASNRARQSNSATKAVDLNSNYVDLWVKR